MLLEPPAESVCDGYSQKERELSTCAKLVESKYKFCLTSTFWESGVQTERQTEFVIGEKKKCEEKKMIAIDRQLKRKEKKKENGVLFYTFTRRK